MLIIVTIRASTAGFGPEMFGKKILIIDISRFAWLILHDIVEYTADCTTLQFILNTVRVRPSSPQNHRISLSPVAGAGAPAAEGRSRSSLPPARRLRGCKPARPLAAATARRRPPRRRAAPPRGSAPGHRHPPS